MGNTINQMFSGNPMNNIFGSVTGTASTGTVDYCTQFESGSAKLLRFKADPDNVGVFKLGAVGTGDCLWPMSAGDDTGWIAPPSDDGDRAGLHSYKYYNYSGGSEVLYWWIQR